MLSRVAVLLASAILVDPGLQVPDGFVVREYADHNLVPDVTCMTIGPKGQIIVAGPGYVRVLLGEKDGRATQAVDLVAVHEPAMGLLAENDSLYAVVDGGLWRWPLAPNGLKVTGPPEKLLPLRTQGEHHAHAVRRGPDGCLYVMVGDGTGIDEKFVNSPTSPIQEPIGGCLIRLSPDGRRREIVADGFRNAYDFNFDSDGFAWTFDSDNERCVSLPWYEPTRIYRIIPGANHGWRAPQRSDTWRCPAYFFDVAAPEATCGRGSPTGLVWQTHPAWPADYHGLFLADWTFGTIWHHIPAVSASPRKFLQPTGDSGFAPTSLAVHPETGELIVSIGGRGTRGAVYRIVPRSIAKHVPKSPSMSPTWAMTARNLVERRLRAGGPTAEDVTLAWLAVCQSDHRAVIQSAASLLAASSEIAIRKLKHLADAPPQWIVLGKAISPRDPTEAGKLALRAFHHTGATPASRLDAVRLLQIALGDITAKEHRASVWAGYSLRSPKPKTDPSTILPSLRQAFPSGHPELDREISRTIALIGDNDLEFARRVAERLTAESDPVDDVHYLIVLSRLNITWTEWMRSRVIDALLALDRKLNKHHFKRDRNWALRLAELHAAFAQRDADFNRALLRHREFGRPDHVLWTKAPGFDRVGAARRFLDNSSRDPEWVWTSEMVSLLAELPPDTVAALLRKLGRVAALRDAVVPVLARRPQSEDLDIFVEGLTSPRLDVVRASLEACRVIRPPSDPKTLAAMIHCGKQLPTGREAEEVRRLLVATLETLTRERHGSDFSRWAKWLAAQHPEEAGRWTNMDGVDAEGWRKRLSSIDWSRGDAERGRTVFRKAQCASCHGGHQALGPDLSGLGQRFSREDRLTAIVQPNRDVPTRYRLTRIETADGRTYHGMIVYEAADGLILQIGASETVRIPASQVESRHLTNRSMMPAGLLDGLSDDEIADLDAYLRSLR